MYSVDEFLNGKWPPDRPPEHPNCLDSFTIMLNQERRKQWDRQSDSLDASIVMKGYRLTRKDEIRALKLRAACIRDNEDDWAR